MGGIGSGRTSRWDSKNTLESCKSMDIRYFNREKLLIPGSSNSLTWSVRGREVGRIGYRVFDDYLELEFRYRRNDEEWRPVKQTIMFTQTPCNYGGHRKWFLCPDCNRRVIVLYAGGIRFLCRHCYHLVYATQHESPQKRSFTKAHKIRRKLAGYSDLTSSFPPKPKGMHWSTYWKLFAQGLKTEETLLLDTARMLGIKI